MIQLAGDNMRHFACMPGQRPHPRPITSIIDTRIALGIANQHPPLQHIQPKAGYLSLRNLQIYLIDIARQRIPDLDFIARGRHKDQRLLDVLAAHGWQVVDVAGVVAFVVLE